MNVACEDLWRPASLAPLPASTSSLSLPAPEQAFTITSLMQHVLLKNKDQSKLCHAKPTISPCYVSHICGT